MAWDENAFSQESYAAALGHAVAASKYSRSSYLAVVTFCSHQQLSSFAEAAETLAKCPVDVFVWHKPDTFNTPGNR